MVKEVATVLGNDNEHVDKRTSKDGQLSFSFVEESLKFAFRRVNVRSRSFCLIALSDYNFSMRPSPPQAQTRLPYLPSNESRHVNVHMVFFVR